MISTWVINNVVNKPKVVFYFLRLYKYSMLEDNEER